MKKILFMLPLVAVCFAACEKDNGNDVNSGQKLVKEISWIDGEYYMSNHYEYDTQNRLVKEIVRMDNFIVYNYNIEYSDNLIIVSHGATDYEADDELNEIYRFYIDDAGFLTKDEIVKMEGASEKVVESREYLYNENGKLKQMKQMTLEYAEDEYTDNSYETIADFEWIHDDMVEGISGITTSIRDIDGERVIWSEFSMYPLEYINVEDKSNICIFCPYLMCCDPSHFNRFIGIRFKGITNKHLYKEYEYEFDFSGYVTKYIDSEHDVEFVIKYY